MGQNYPLPPGTQPIHADDPWRPGEKRLVGAYDRTSIHFFRPQDKRHYPVPKKKLFDAAEIELLELLEAEARRQGLLPADVARQLLAGGTRQQVSAQAAAAIEPLRPVAERLGIDLVALAARLAEWADLMMEVQAAAMVDGVGAREYLERVRAFNRSRTTPVS